MVYYFKSYSYLFRCSNCKHMKDFNDETHKGRFCEVFVREDSLDKKDKRPVTECDSKGNVTCRKYDRIKSDEEVF